jgi:hypothetical protein
LVVAVQVAFDGSHPAALVDFLPVLASRHPITLTINIQNRCPRTLENPSNPSITFLHSLLPHPSHTPHPLILPLRINPIPIQKLILMQRRAIGPHRITLRRIRTGIPNYQTIQINMIQCRRVIIVLVDGCGEEGYVDAGVALAGNKRGLPRSVGNLL